MSLNSLLLLLIFGGIAIIGYFVKDLPICLGTSS